jgi:uncharacterized membrane protein (UPF0127 family)
MNDSRYEQPLRQWSLLANDTGRVVVDDLRIADGYWSKLAGLQFRAPIAIGRGLLLVKEASIHTFWMRFAIDAAFIGGDGTVIGIRRAVRPWRIALGPPGTHAILETRAGWLELEAGTRLSAAFVGSPDRFRQRRALSFLGRQTPGGGREQHTTSEPERQNA